MKGSQTVIALFLHFIFSQALPAQALYPQTLTTQQNLSSNQYNWFVYHDSYGFVWVSSIAGLNRFDGYRNKVYHADRNDPHALPNEVGAQNQIQEDANGDLWFASSTSLTRYNRATDDFTTFRHTDARGDTINTHYPWARVTPDGKGLYTTAGDQLYYHDIGDWSSARHVAAVPAANYDPLLFPPGAPPGTFSLVILRPNGNELLLHDFVDFQLVGTPRTIAAPQPIGFTSVAVGPTNDVWISGRAGVFRFNWPEETWTVVSELSGKAGLQFNSVSITPSGEVLAGTASTGVFAIDPNSLRAVALRQLSTSDGSAEIIRTDLTHGYVGRDGTYWISTENEGLRFMNLREPKFSLSDPQPFTAGSNILDLAVARNGDVYALSDSVVYHLTPTDTTTLELPMSAISFRRTRSITVDRNQNLWVATYGGLLYKPAGEDYRAIPPLPPPRTGYAYLMYSGVYENGNEGLIVPLYDRGVYSLANADATPVPWGGGLSSIQNLSLSGGGHALVNTNSDTSYVVRTSGDEFPVLATFPDVGLVTETKYDPTRRCYWLSTFTGLFRIDGATDGEWSITQLRSDSLRGISAFELTDDAIWCATTRDVRRVALPSGRVTVYTQSDGIQRGEHNFGASATLPDGQLIFGGAGGITVIDPTVKSALAPARALVAEFLVNGSVIPPPSDRLSLPHDSNKVELLLFTGEYSDRSQAQFRYSFTTDGVPSYGAPSNRPSVLLEQLQPATYYLSVLASNADGAWSQEPYELEITIRPPWYATWWAYTLYLATALGLLGAFLYYRYRQLRRVEIAQLDRARAEQVAAETETSVLRLQMNPHFIFNSLNSIDDYILDREPLVAHDYLVLFADLMRDILTRSTQAFTRLDEELELLTRYVAAERRRLGDGLRLTIDTAAEVDEVSTYLPTMILQPFVENAIWHGIGHRAGGGVVTLRFYHQSGRLVAEVQDDGRGRGNAGQVGKQHSSKALDITTRRLTLLAASLPEDTLGKATIRYEIEDLENEDGLPTGTLVRLWLPLMYG